jgi:hypothetical protein
LKPILAYGLQNGSFGLAEVTNDEGMALAKKFGMQFYSTSAKTGAGVEELFSQQTQKILHLRAER